MVPFCLRLSMLIIVYLQYSSSYELKSCCLTEQNNSTRLLSCPLNFLIQLRSVKFYTGNGCATSSCEKRLNKHYLYCNQQRTCSISILCVNMDSLSCANQSEYLTVHYDCQLATLPVNPVLFSAQVNIETPDEHDEEQWKDHLLKKYLEEQTGEKPRSLLSDILRTTLILVIFALILILVMLIAFFIYKRLKMSKVSKEKHRPFPSPDDAYDNLKTSPTQSITESASDV